MRISTTGIVIRERVQGESGKLVTLLTNDLGVITVSAKGALKLTASFRRCTQLYAYSELTLYEKNGFYTLLEGALIKSFFPLCERLDTFALAAYLCEVSASAALPGESEGGIMNLLLNSLYALSSNLFCAKFVKAVFEIRITALAGLEPETETCPDCGKPLRGAERRLFFPVDGVVVCGDCAGTHEQAETPVFLSDAVYSAINYIINAPAKSVFSFRVSESALDDLAAVAENYLKIRLERGFPTLDFYHSLDKLNDGISPCTEEKPEG